MAHMIRGRSMLMMATRCTLLAASVLASSLHASAATDCSAQAAPAATDLELDGRHTADTLRSLAAPLGIAMGAQASWRLLSAPLNATMPTFDDIHCAEYSMLTVNTLYWAEVEPTRGQFNFTPTWASLAHAHSCGQATRCHNLLWHQSLPSWVNASLSNAELADIAKVHIDTIVTELKGECDFYDVVNEPLNGDGTLRDTLWKRALGDDYIVTVLGWVHAIDPAARLVVNDFGAEPQNAKAAGMLALFKRYTGMGVPFHVVGLESHLHLSDAPNVSSIAANVAQLTEAGAEVQVTELDLSLNNTEALGSAATKWDAQGQYAGQLLAALLPHAGSGAGHVSAFVTWGVNDFDSWVGMLERNPVSTNGGYQLAPLPFNANDFTRKPFYHDMASALSNASGRVYSHLERTPLPTEARAAEFRRVGTQPVPSADAVPLRDLADAHGIFIGSASPGRAADLAGGPGDPVYPTVIGREYSIITAAELYWPEVEPVEGHFNFTNVDATIAFAQQHNQTVWYTTLPPWINETLSAERLRGIMENHVTKIMEHLKGKCYAVDVVNEPLDIDGTPRQSVWFKAYNGTGYIQRALELAHAADSAAKLFINDYEIEEICGKSTGIISLLANLTAAGAPVHGIGFESHWMLVWGGANLTSVSANMDRFQERFPHMELHVTEFDLSLDQLPGSIAAGWTQQAAMYAGYLRVCLQHAPWCRSFETWDLTDRYSWLGELEDNPISNNAGYMFAPLPFDTRYRPKPAYWAMWNALKGGAA